MANFHTHTSGYSINGFELDPYKSASSQMYNGSFNRPTDKIPGLNIVQELKTNKQNYYLYDNNGNSMYLNHILKDTFAIWNNENDMHTIGMCTFDILNKKVIIHVNNQQNVLSFDVVSLVDAKVGGRAKKSKARRNGKKRNSRKRRSTRKY